MTSSDVKINRIELNLNKIDSTPLSNINSMKKHYFLFVLIAVTVLLSSRVQAQSTANSAAFNLNVNLTADVLSIQLGASPDVQFAYANTSDYTTAKTVSKVGHVTVVSSRPYNLSAQAVSNFTSSGTGTLALNVVNINVDPTTLNGGTPVGGTLSTTGTSLVTAATPTVGSSFNMNYSIPSAAGFVGQSVQNFTTTVTYTASQI